MFCDYGSSILFISFSYITEILLPFNGVSGFVVIINYLVGLKFNGPVNIIKVMSNRSVYITTLILGRLSPLSY